MPYKKEEVLKPSHCKPRLHSGSVFSTSSFFMKCNFLFYIRGINTFRPFHPFRRLALLAGFSQECL